MTALKEMLAALETDGVDYVRCQFIDLIGIARGRLVPRHQVAEACERGLAFGAFGTTLDIDDIPSDPALGSHTGDFWAVPDFRSYSPLPWTQSTGHMFSDLVSADGIPWPSCPRSALTRIATAVSGEIGAPEFAFEAEGYLLVRSGDGYVPAYHGHGWGSELLDIHDKFIHELTEVAGRMSLPIERMQVEGGASQFEIAMRYGPPLETAQEYFRFKQAFRAVARHHGLVGSFMPKPVQDRDGSGLHIHLSFKKNSHDPLFDGPDLSDIGHAFVGGLIAHAGALVAIGCPSVNSYRRMVPGFWAPTHAIWAKDNRSALVRVLANERHSSRIEFRGADGTCNPFLLAAALMAAGLDGVRRNLDPGKPFSGDVARTSAAELEELGVVRLPSSLDRALDSLQGDHALAKVLGADLVRALLFVKRSEFAKWAGYVTPWEYRYYAEQY